ncbi:MAG: NADH-quinone oxidoreductase subunit K [Trueperaceae bacterium]|nr:NADH-quinone oxidoreductase subunit K [Trueperaceae bacterium]
MELPLALTVGVLFGSGLYLVLQRNLLRLIFGLILMSGGVNLALFVAGRLTRGRSPFVPEGTYAPPVGAANPLPQALILTAIVISFGLTVFALVLLLRTYERLGTVETDELPLRLRDPHPPAVSLPASSGPRATPAPESSGGTSDSEVSR